MNTRPVFDNPNYKGNGKLKDRVSIITSRDSRQVFACYCCRVFPKTIWTPLIPTSFPTEQVANWGVRLP
nr:hypothetical protein [Brevibacillus laterosporus]